MRLRKTAKDAFTLAAFMALFWGGAAFADISRSVTRVFELNAKLRPGMTIDAMNELLGPPAEEYRMGGDKASTVTRYSWLHGEMGIEAYEVEGAAYRVDITLPCGSGLDALRAMDALTRQGRTKYGNMPRFDQATSQYYWVRDGVRFAFSKYNSTTVLSSCTRAR